MNYNLFNRVYIPLYSKGRWAPTKNNLGRGTYNLPMILRITPLT